MRILQVHNYYQNSGGEDIVFQNEYELLKGAGHDVVQFTKRNDVLKNYSFFDKVKLLFETSYSTTTFREFLKIIKKFDPDVCHIHNILPLISPSVYSACNYLNIPVIQTLHNFRLLCSNAYLYRNDKICEQCLGHSLYNSLKYKCYRDSRVQTYALARMIETSKKDNVWTKKIDAYISLTEFSKAKFIRAGFPKNKIFVKPNFVSNDPGVCVNKKDYFIFAGRIEYTKGIEVLLQAIKKISSGINVFVVGDGPLRSKVATQLASNYLGQLNHQSLLKKINMSRALIFPSVWYETFGLVIIEAYACGVPVIASNTGAMKELVQDGKTGLLFRTGDSLDLASKLQWAYDHEAEMIEMGLNARRIYEQKYSKSQNYKALISIYMKVIKSHQEAN